ncbi:CobW/HypB/UreG, nucleotide-binding domain-containing protein [Lipomyces starkeyi]
MSALNIDASLITHHKVTTTKEKLIQLQNGCICCTLRGDLLSELATLAKSGAFQYVVIESTGISEPMQVAETFTSEFSRALMDDQEDAAGDGNNEADESEKAILKEIVDLGGLHNVAVLDTTVTVVDSSLTRSTFSLSSRLWTSFLTVRMLGDDRRDSRKKGVDVIDEDFGGFHGR